MMRAAREMPSRLLWLSISFTTLSYLALIGRDACALIYIDSKVPAASLLLASFCGSALGNAIGFGTLTGGAVRERVYGAVGLRTEQIDRITLFIDVGFGVGLPMFAAGSTLLAGSALARLLSISTILLDLIAATLLVALVSLVVSGVLQRRRLAIISGLSIAMPAPTVALFQFVLTQLDLLGASAALWVLMPATSIGFFSFAAIVAVAIGLGVISRIPGGLGVFDTIVFLSLAGHVPHNKLAGALLIYRGVYFLLPLVLAAGSLAAFEMSRDSGARAPMTGGRVLMGADLLAPIFLGVLTFSAGVMLILSGATPAVDWRLAALQSVLPLWAVEISHLLAALAGVLLLFVARGLFHRLDGAWWVALIITLLNVALSLAKGLAFGETAALLFLLFLLLATRRQFSRPAAFLRQRFTVGWFTAIAVVIAAATGIMFFAFRAGAL